MSKYIEIIEYAPSDTGKTFVWQVRNKRTNDEVGKIRWYGGWRKYAFFINVDGMAWVALDSDCMRKIADFLDDVNRKKRATKKP